MTSPESVLGATAAADSSTTADSAGPAAKRVKANGDDPPVIDLCGADDEDDESSSWDQVINPEILANEAVYRSQYLTSRPFPHGILPNLFKTSFLESVRHEIKVCIASSLFGTSCLLTTWSSTLSNSMYLADQPSEGEFQGEL
jgi:hypothetical protein